MDLSHGECRLHCAFYYYVLCTLWLQVPQLRSYPLRRLGSVGCYQSCIQYTDRTIIQSISIFDRCVTLPILHAHPKYMSGVLFLFIDAHELSFLRRSAVSMLIPVKPSSLVIC